MYNIRHGDHDNDDGDDLIDDDMNTDMKLYGVDEPMNPIDETIQRIDDLIRWIRCADSLYKSLGVVCSDSGIKLVPS